MGIKGRKKREREREEKRQRDIDAGLIDPDDDDDAPFAVFGDGPFQPPAGAKAPQLSNSELYRQRDEEVLEGMRDAHAKRRQSHLPTRKRARAEEEDEAEADTFLQPVDLTAEALIEATKERQRTEAVSLASGARFSHILLGIQPLLVTALSNEGFSRMTCIQERVIPLAIEGFDILGQAKTGSGKTLAFCIPVLQTTLAVHSKHAKSCLAVMMAPTKELCVQTHQIFEGGVSTSDLHGKNFRAVDHWWNKCSGGATTSLGRRKHRCGDPWPSARPRQALQRVEPPSHAVARARRSRSHVRYWFQEGP